MSLTSLPSSMALPERLPQMWIPDCLPETLDVLLQELSTAHQQQSLPNYANYLRDSLGFLTRYFTGTILAASRALQLPCPNITGILTVEESVPILIAQIEILKTNSTPLSLNLRNCFLEDDGSPRGFYQLLCDPETVVAFCKQDPRVVFPSEAELHDEEHLKRLTPSYRSYLRGLLKRYLKNLETVAPILMDWLEWSQPWFLDCEHRYEAGALFGQMELVMVFERFTLNTGMMMRMQELRTVPSSTALVSSDSSASEDMDLSALLDLLPDIPEEKSDLLTSLTAEPSVALEPASQPEFPMVQPDPVVEPEPVLETKPVIAEPPATPTPAPIAPLVGLGLPIAEPERQSLATNTPVVEEAATKLEPEAPSAPILEKPPKLKKPTQESSQELLMFIQKRLQEANTRVEQHKKTPAVKAPEYHLSATIEQTGLRRNANGTLGYAGYIWIRVETEEELELEGMALSKNPRILLDPPRFYGQGSRVVFWIDPEELQSPRGQVEILGRVVPKGGDRSNLEAASTSLKEPTYQVNSLAAQKASVTAEVENTGFSLRTAVPVWKLLPESTLASLTDRQLWAGLLAPPLLGGVYTTWVFFSSDWKTRSLTEKALGRDYARLTNPANQASTGEAGVGFLELKVQPQIEAALLMFFLYAWLAPTASALIFRRVPHHRKEDAHWIWAVAPVLPSLIYLLLWKTPLTSDPLYLHPEYAGLDFRNSLQSFMFLNLLAAVFVHLWQKGIIQRPLNSVGRIAVWVLFVAFCGFYTFMMVYARSWFS